MRPTVNILRGRGATMLRVLTAWTVFAVVVSPAFGWNALGHKTVAEIAWRQLDPETRQRIVEVIRRHPRFDADFVAKMEDDAARGDKQTQDHWIFLHAATWPDLARDLPAGERSKYDRPLWHYVDLPLYLNPSDQRAFRSRLPVNISMKYPAPIDQKDYNVVQALAYCQETLRQPGAGADRKALAYCWLFHLVGDIHQPLHSTALFSAEHFPKGDRGGNEILLTRGKNLHALWDNLLGRQYYMRNVEKVAAELSDQQRYGEVWQSAAAERSPRKWADESHRLCESFVYTQEILDAVRQTSPDQKLAPIELPDSYMKQAGNHARLRIIAAGIRLGAMLQTVPER